ncbi:toxin-antitoxin system TumE family protein [Salinarimonas sp. NSM]|uniref:toxin-antitoxin system TumE family protein n=1 Tax=Salinarimonas sp. NSM TaxID=3458003 RepID=UPI0040353B98
MIELAGTYRLTNGWTMAIRAEWCDPTPGRPRGLDYALNLMDGKDRVLGLDNSHGFDGAGEHDPFDHEHPDGRVEQRVRYAFTTAQALIAGFFARVEAACERRGIPFEFEDETDE